MAGKYKIAAVLGVLGVVCLIAADYLNEQAASSARVSALMGRGAESSPGPWIAVALGAACLIAAVVAALWPAPKAPAFVPGWYDDPESPTRLRYREVSGWTDRTAAKGDAS